MVHDFIKRVVLTSGVVLTKRETAKDREEKEAATTMMEEREREENKINHSW